MFAGWLWCRERIWRRQHQRKTHATDSTSAHLPETTHWSLYSYLCLIVDFWCMIINTLDLGWWNSNSAKPWGLERSALRCLTETRGQEDRISSWKTNEIKEGRGFYICKIFSQLALHIWKIEHLSDTTGWCWARRVRTIARWKPGLRGRSPPSTTRERWGLSSTSFLSTFSLRFFFNFFGKIFFEVYLERCEFRDGGGESLSDCADRNLWGKRAQRSMWWRRFFQYCPKLKQSALHVVEEVKQKWYKIKS